MGKKRVVSNVLLVTFSFVVINKILIFPPLPLVSSSSSYALWIWSSMPSTILSPPAWFLLMWKGCVSPKINYMSILWGPTQIILEKFTPRFTTRSEFFTHNYLQSLYKAQKEYNLHQWKEYPPTNIMAPWRIEIVYYLGENYWMSQFQKELEILFYVATIYEFSKNDKMVLFCM